jgi:DNA repair exonuclease SbcCD ATPase subunit
MKKILSPARSVIAAALIAGLAIPAHAQLREALTTGEQATRKAEQVQDQINQLDDDRSEMVREYRTLLQRRDAAELFAKQQELVVESQREEIASLTEQLGSIDDITAQTVPMLHRALQAISDTVAAGGTPCEDPPGVREGPGGKIYLAYLRDPDGNKLCGLFRMPRA